MITLPLHIDNDRLLVVYTVHTKANGPVWVGISLASQVWALPDMRARPDVRQLVEDDGNPTLMFHGLTDDIGEARQQAHELARVMPSAVATFDSYAPALQGRKVRRNDGVIYSSAREAARANGANPANLSKHLNRKPGFVSVAGHVFEWVA